MKPPMTAARTVAKPYTRPKPRARACTLCSAPLVPPMMEPVAVAGAVEDAGTPAAVDGIELLVLVLTLTGFCAPHGWAVRQVD